MIKGKQADFELGGKPDGEDALHLVNRSLKWLWADDTKKTYEEAVYSLTWEELVGSLMEAKAYIELNEWIKEGDREWQDRCDADGICITCGHQYEPL